MFLFLFLCKKEYIWHPAGTSFPAPSCLSVKATANKAGKYILDLGGAVQINLGVLPRVWSCRGPGVAVPETPSFQAVKEEECAKWSRIAELPVWSRRERGGRKPSSEAVAAVLRDREDALGMSDSRGGCD